MPWPFQTAYEGDFRSLCTVTFGQKVDFEMDCQNFDMYHFRKQSVPKIRFQKSIIFVFLIILIIFTESTV